MENGRFCVQALACIGLAMALSKVAVAGDPPDSVRPLITQASLNVYRRFEPEITAAMVTFYDEVLGLEPLQPIDLGGGQQMILFAVGSGQIKLAAGLKEGRSYHGGAPQEATGIRVLTFFFADEAALIDHFVSRGLATPEFQDIGDGRRAALVTDPGGFTLELAVLPDAAPGEYARVEVGINVSDIAQAREFYGGFLGLDELAPVTDHLLGVTRHPFRHGETTINLWSVGEDLPADTGSAGIQYVVSDVDAIDAMAAERGITVETPLGGLPGFDLRFVWLNDADGVTNYFAQIGAASSGPND